MNMKDPGDWARFLYLSRGKRTLLAPLRDDVLQIRPARHSPSTLSMDLIKLKPFRFLDKESCLVTPELEFWNNLFLVRDIMGKIPISLSFLWIVIMRQTRNQSAYLARI